MRSRRFAKALRSVMTPIFVARKDLKHNDKARQPLRSHLGGVSCPRLTRSYEGLTNNPN